MSDLFHEDVSLPFISQVFDVMERAHWHQFQVLTKRSQRLSELSNKNTLAPECYGWGVSVENQDCTSRIDCLKETGAAIKFLSLEPLIGPLNRFEFGIHRLGYCGMESLVMGRDLSKKNGSLIFAISAKLMMFHCL